MWVGSQCWTKRTGSESRLARERHITEHVRTEYDRYNIEDKCTSYSLVIKKELKNENGLNMRVGSQRSAKRADSYMWADSFGNDSSLVEAYSRHGGRGVRNDTEEKCTSYAWVKDKFWCFMR